MTTFKDVSGNADAGTAQKWGGNNIMSVDRLFDDIDVSADIINGTGHIRINTPWRFRSGKLILRDTGNDHNLTILMNNLAANRNLTIPLMTADGNMVVDSFANTFTAAQTVNLNATTLATLFKPINTASTEWGINFDARDSANNQTNYVQLQAGISDNTDTSEDGFLKVYVNIGGSLTRIATFRETGTFLCGGSNARVEISDSGLTGIRTITFKDTSMRCAREDGANTFTAAQTINGTVSLGGSSARITLDDAIESTSRTYNYPDIGSIGGQNARVKVQSHDYFEMEDEFTMGNISNTVASNAISVLNWGLSSVGTSTPTILAGVTTHPGIIELTTSAAANDSCRIHLTDSVSRAFMDPTDLERMAFIVRLPNLTSITVRLGLMQDVSAANGGTAGAFFQFDSATDADSWSMVTRQASTSTTNTSAGANAVANNWMLLEIYYNLTDWLFYINNTLAFTHTTNKPTTACNVGMVVFTTTTAAKSLDIDYFKIRTKKLAQRWT